MPITRRSNDVARTVLYYRSVVDQQYAELRRSLSGLGDLQLTPSFASRHLTTQMHWNHMSDDAKDRAFAKVMSDDGTAPEKKTATSTDGLLTIVGSPRIAMKKGQRRRPVAEKTRIRK